MAHPCRVLCPALLLLLLLPPLVLSQAAAEPQWPNVTSALDNVYGGSKAAPFTRALARTPGARAAFGDLAGWFAGVSGDVAARRNLTDGSECTLRGQQWIEESREYMEDRRLPPPDKSCATRTEHAPGGGAQRRAFELLARSAAAIGAAGRIAVQADPALRKLWGGRGAHAHAGLVYTRDKQQCVLDYATAARVAGQWYVAAAVTSQDVATVGPRRARAVELVHSGFKPPLQMLLRPRAGGGPPARYTTAFAEGAGAARISRITDMRFDENSALSAALEANLLAVDQANDALTKSNFAILALPLAMSFIPVALIADVSDAATFFYVLLTDVFSAVPFVIKGIELVQTGTTTIRNAETWLVGEASGTEMAETWAAACRPQDSFRVLGIIVILVGLGAIALGIGLEYATRKWMARLREKGEHPEPLGPALLHMQGYIPVGAHYMPRNVNYDDPLAPNVAADLPPPPPPAGGPPPGGFVSLFSGALRNRPFLPGVRRARGGGGAGAQPEVPPDRAVDDGGNTTLANLLLGVTRRRTNAQSSGNSAVYEA